MSGLNLRFKFTAVSFGRIGVKIRRGSYRWNLSGKRQILSELKFEFKFDELQNLAQKRKQDKWIFKI